MYAIMLIGGTMTSFTIKQPQLQSISDMHDIENG